MRAHAGYGMRSRRATSLLLAAILAATSLAVVAPATPADSAAGAAAKKKKKKCKKGFVRKEGKCKRKRPGGTTTPVTTIPVGTTPLTGGPTSLSITPTSHDFGTVHPDDHSDPQSFLVANTGANPASPITFTTTGEHADEFHVGNDLCSGRTLAAGGTCTLNVTFAPGPFSLGPREGALQINGPPAAPVSASLSGFGGL
jgi:hypothetical protein